MQRLRETKDCWRALNVGVKMGKRSAHFKTYLVKKITNPQERANYIKAALEDGDPKILLAVLRDCVEAMGGVSWMAHESHMTRAAIYRILTSTGNPKFDSLQKLLAPLGLRISVETVSNHRKKELTRIS
jgi:probable addiction module antidote protein